MVTSFFRPPLLRSIFSWKRTLIFFLFTTAVHAQNNTAQDSLLQAYKGHQPDTAKVNTLGRLVSSFMYQDYDKSKAFAEEQLELANSLGFTKGQAKANYFLGVLFNNVDQADSARYYYKKAKVLAREAGETEMIFDADLGLSILEYAAGNLNEAEVVTDENLKTMIAAKDTLNMAVLYQFKGLINQMKGHYSISYENLIKALRFLEAIDNSIRKADVLNYLGGVEYHQKNYQRGIDYNLQALKIYEENSDNGYAAQAMNDIGLAFIQMEVLDSAQHYLTASLEKSKAVQARTLQAVTLGNLGTLHWKKEEYAQAVERLREGIAISKEIGNLRQQRESELKLGVTYNSWDKPQLALPLIDPAIAYAQANDAPVMLKDAYKARTLSNQKLGRYPQAIADMEEAMRLRDTVFNNDKTTTIEELRTIYETEKREQELALQENKIELLEAKAEVDGLKQSLLWVGLAVLAIVFGLVFYSLRQRMKRNRLEREKLDADLSFKQKELTTHTLHLAHKNEVLLDLKKQISTLKQENGNNRRVQNVINTINLDINNERNWDQFKSYFEDVHRDFNVNVKNQYPEVSANDLRFMALMRMNLSSKEIANILNISPEGVKKSRYRLRKKMELEPEESLEDIILSF